MDSESDNDICIYRIDNRNRIVSLSGNWLSFAADNNGLEKNTPDKIVGVSVFDCITGHDTKQLYQIILGKVRSCNKSVKLLFRCDSPNLCRYLQLSIIPLEDSFVEFQSIILRTEPRETVELLKNDIGRSDDFIKICSVCKNIKVSDTEWEETEVAINTLRIFDTTRLPQLTHGLCLACFDAVMAELNAWEQ